MQALQLDPKYVKAWAKKGDIEFFMKEYHKALDSYKMVGIGAALCNIAMFGLSHVWSLQGMKLLTSRRARRVAATEPSRLRKSRERLTVFSLTKVCDCRTQGLTVEPKNSLCVDGVKKTSLKISEVSHYGRGVYSKRSRFICDA